MSGEEAREHEPLGEAGTDDRGPDGAPRADDGRAEEEQRERVREQRGIARRDGEVDQRVRPHAEDDEDQQPVDRGFGALRLVRAQVKLRQQQVGRIVLQCRSVGAFDGCERGFRSPEPGARCRDCRERAAAL